MIGQNHYILSSQTIQPILIMFCCLDMYDREDQFVVSEILNIWQNKHFKLMNDLAISCKRVGGLLDSTKQVAAEAQIN